MKNKIIIGALASALVVETVLGAYNIHNTSVRNTSQKEELNSTIQDLMQSNSDKDNEIADLQSTTIHLQDQVQELQDYADSLSGTLNEMYSKVGYTP